MPHKVGDTAYSVWYDEDERRLEFTLEVCRCVRKTSAYYTSRVQYVTWVRVLKPVSAWTWAASIPAYCRRRVNANGPLPSGWGRSKVAAARSALAGARRTTRRFGEDEYSRREIAALKRYVSRYGGKA